MTESQATKPVRIGSITIGGGAPLALFAGPCVIESRAVLAESAAALKEIAGRLGLPLIFKSSFDKANRTSLSSFRGPGIEEGLAMLSRVRDEFGVPILTDIHEPWQAARAAEVADVLQIPAFLCRQTDLLLAAGRTGKAVNIKKGQFMAPTDMAAPAEKVASTGNESILLTERGCAFGYNRLVVDMAGLRAMRGLGWPVLFDATHAVQRPTGAGSASSGNRGEVPALSRAAAAVGIDGLFVEVHPEPDAALCDGPNMVALSDLRPILESVIAIDAVVRKPGVP
jgi:2-dehydro-3-deoxyphosphooctonate aldolase (KDO 8-P synthase)